MKIDNEGLEPPNEHKHVLLPDSTHSVSTRPSSHGSINAAYQNGISFIDQMGSIGGYLTIVGGFGFLFCATTSYLIISDGGFLWFIAAMVIIAFACLLIVRFDAMGYRYQPVIFNRATQKIHVFVDEGIGAGKMWHLASPSRIDTWDWSCARAEIVEFMTLGGAGVPRQNYALICAITDEPGGQIAVSRFGVGIVSVHEADYMLQRWEHIRRFMGENGPHLAAGDTPYLDETAESLWAAMTWGQPLLGPGSKFYWTGELHNGMWFLTIPVSAFFLIFLPFTVVAGLMRWLSHRAKRDPTWPQEILDRLGPELHAREIAPALAQTAKAKITPLD